MKKISVVTLLVVFCTVAALAQVNGSDPLPNMKTKGEFCKAVSDCRGQVTVTKQVVRHRAKKAVVTKSAFAEQTVPPAETMVPLSAMTRFAEALKQPPVTINTQPSLAVPPQIVVAPPSQIDQFGLDELKRHNAEEERQLKRQADSAHTANVIAGFGVGALYLGDAFLGHLAFSGPNGGNGSGGGAKDMIFNITNTAFGGSATANSSSSSSSTANIIRGGCKKRNSCGKCVAWW